ncbi:DUF6734 family protein [Dyadobacter chenhuakuii]|uniref:DUF6734 domain-containing protein n=1 Tax=Dyadobacter chenhuakuii TaxID=2909339 RepID=A0ABY4XM23_9BACT|nr:DUF6734 family protein [Dyadobacter chenhuakuii]MCF2494306.1 hypothetical protein [Dyadobacter chenhuakuii]USJ31430.1 hypothetical protein NFI80_01550 [Dyadobacter chenhuakuii]
MKIVQSTWFPDKNDISGRWSSEKSMLYNLNLSYIMLKKFYSDIELHTDNIGYQILVKELGLQYSNVVIDLERPSFSELCSFNIEPYWVLKKLFIYSQQHTPFIHVDNDVYLFRQFSEKITKSALCAQNIEINSYYTDALETIQQKFTYVPNWLKQASKDNCHAVNAGIIGGNNFHLFGLYFQEVVELLERNRDKLTEISVGNMNIFLEQCMFKIYADYHDASFEYQIDFVYKDKFSYNAYKIHDAPKLSTYIHVMSCKSNSTVQEAIAKTLYYEDQNAFTKCKYLSEYRFKKDNKEKISNELLFGNSEDLRHHFYRTEAIASEISEDIKINFENLDSIESSVRKNQYLLPINLYELIVDAYYFEYQRYKFALLAVNNPLNYYYDNYVKAKRMLDSSAFMDCTYSIPDTVTLLSTRWLWAQKNEFATSSVDDFKDNVNKSSNYFETLVYYYPEQEKIKEQELDPINSLIYEYASHSMTTRSIIDKLRLNTTSNQSLIDLETVFESRIRYLIHQGALTLVSPN